MNVKLSKLAELEGFADPFDMLEAYSIETAVPGICSNLRCDYTAFFEPDSREGYCEKCGTQSVVSCLVLAGVI